MNLQQIGYKFARERGIPFVGQRVGVLGARNGYLVGISDKGARKRVFIFKDFPVKGLIESGFVIEDSGQEVSLHSRVLYGCLPDYLQLLKGAPGDLCEIVRSSLDFDNRFIQDARTLVKDSFKVKEMSDIQTLLRYLYPN